MSDKDCLIPANHPDFAMPTKKTYQLGTAFESKFGFARAVRKAHLIFVSGTTALKLSEDGDESDGSGVHHRDDAGKQASLSMQRCVDGVKALGGEREDITRVRMFVRVRSPEISHA